MLVLYVSPQWVVAARIKIYVHVLEYPMKLGIEKKKKKKKELLVVYLLVEFRL